jgi:hypothetical protein
VTPDEYDAVMAAMRLDDELPSGGIVHVAGFEGGALRVLDVWESAEQFQRFQEQRLGPAIEQAGIDRGEPNVRVYELHNVYVPDATALARMGSSSRAGANA